MILLTTVLTAIVVGWLGQICAGAASRAALRTVAVQTDEAMPTSVFVTRAAKGITHPETAHSKGRDTESHCTIAVVSALTES